MKTDNLIQQIRNHRGALLKLHQSLTATQIRTGAYMELSQAINKLDDTLTALS